MNIFQLEINYATADWLQLDKKKTEFRVRPEAGSVS